jgi:hypothetical protein
MRPGMASELLRELAPLLGEEGIDVDNIDVPDLGTLQQAVNRAIERQNMVRFTPVGLEYAIVAVACFFSQQPGAVTRRSGTRV